MKGVYALLPFNLDITVSIGTGLMGAFIGFLERIIICYPGFFVYYRTYCRDIS